MKTKQKIVLLCLMGFIMILPACFEKLHETSSTQSKTSINDVNENLNQAVKGTMQGPLFKREKPVSNVIVSKDGFTLVNTDNTTRYFDFNQIRDPNVTHEKLAKVYVVNITHQAGNNVIFRDFNSAKMFADALYYLKHSNDPEVKQERARENEDCLRQVRNTPVEPILAGATAADLNLPCSGAPQDQIEAALNDILVEWKSKGFISLIRHSTASQLNDLIIKMEKGILNLDHKVRQLKDLADEDARRVQAPGQPAPKKKALELQNLAHLLEQRKTILIVILNSVKQVAAY